jgi:hypothetical protein
MVKSSIDVAKTAFVDAVSTLRPRPSFVADLLLLEVKASYFV